MPTTPDFDHDTLVREAFMGFRATPLPPSAHTADDARGTVRRRRQVRLSVVAAAVVLVAAVPVAANALVGRSSHGSAPAASTTVAPEPSATATPSAGTASASPDPSASASPAAPDPRTIDLNNATIDVPSTPGFETPCPAGPRQFVNGKATATHVGQDEISYSILAAGPQGTIYTDLDGEPGNEALLTIVCRNNSASVYVPRLVALKPMPDGTLRTLGAINTDTDNVLLDFQPGNVEVDGRTVLVPLTGTHNEYRMALQTRGYRYDNGSFHQVSGPTRFGPIPTTIHQADLPNALIGVSGGLGDCNNGCGSEVIYFVDGIGRVTERVSKEDSNKICVYVTHDTVAKCGGFMVFTYTIQQTSFVKGADGSDLALMTVLRRNTDGATAQAVVAVRPDGGIGLDAHPVVSVGMDGITAIVGEKGVGDIAQITVRTANGQETRSYREPVGGGLYWTRVN